MTDPGLADPAAWSDHVFCLIAPDCLRRHLSGAVLRRFRDIGLCVAGWRLLRVTSRHNDTIAAIQGAGAGSTYRYRAIDALFDVGPALALRLRDESAQPSVELYAQAQRLKGASHPQDCVPGSIRHDLGAINAVMNLLHVSDSPVNSAGEAAVLLSGIDPPLFLPAERLPSAIPIVEAGRPVETRGFPAVLTAVRARVAAALWDLLSDKGKVMAAELSGDGSLADPRAGEALAAELAPAGASHPLAAVLRIPFDPSGPLTDLRYAAGLLRLHGLGLDDWEYAVLATSLYFPPVR